MIIRFDMNLIWWRELRIKNELRIFSGSNWKKIKNHEAHLDLCNSFKSKTVYYSSAMLIQWNLSIADTYGTAKRCPLIGGVRYIEVVFKNFVMFWSECFVRYWGCPLLGGSTSFDVNRSGNGKFDSDKMLAAKNSQKLIKRGPNKDGGGEKNFRKLINRGTFIWYLRV